MVPPIPGRADYIHYIAELLEKKDNVKVLDIGTGANCIYPIIGSQSYGWNFVASDIDSKSIENAQKIIDANKNLKDKIIDYKTYRFNIIFFQNLKIIFQNHIQI